MCTTSDQNTPENDLSNDNTSCLDGCHLGNRVSYVYIARKIIRSKLDREEVDVNICFYFILII